MVDPLPLEGVRARVRQQEISGNERAKARTKTGGIRENGGDAEAHL